MKRKLEYLQIMLKQAESAEKEAEKTVKLKAGVKKTFKTGCTVIGNELWDPRTTANKNLKKKMNNVDKLKAKIAEAEAINADAGAPEAPAPAQPDKEKES